MRLSVLVAQLPFATQSLEEPLPGSRVKECQSQTTEVGTFTAKFLRFPSVSGSDFQHICDILVGQL